MVFIDGDGQHDPRYLPNLLKPILTGRAQVSIGSRYLGVAAEGLNPWRSRAIQAITRLFNICYKTRLTDAQCGFRAFGPKAASLTKPAEDGMEASLETLAKSALKGLRIEEVPVGVTYRIPNPHTSGSVAHGGRLISYLVFRRPRQQAGGK